MPVVILQPSYMKYEDLIRDGSITMNMTNTGLVQAPDSSFRLPTGGKVHGMHLGRLQRSLCATPVTATTWSPVPRVSNRSCRSA